MLVGVAQDERGKAALHLAAMLARSSGEDLLLCSVVPTPWFPGSARVDAEYHAWLDSTADEALDHAKAMLPADIGATVVRHAARSAPTGLLEVAELHQASLIVVGSSTAGTFGHVALGSVTDRLLHSSQVPVALAPRGFRAKGDARIARVTAAYGGSDQADELVVAAAGVAARVGASLRLASFAVRPRPPMTAGLGGRAENPVVAQWVKDVEAYGIEALERVAALPAVPHDLALAIGYGESWDEAVEDVEWDDGDILVVGSSAIGPFARVFLGSRASKILRHSPAPVLVVPRAAAEELAEQAEGLEQPEDRKRPEDREQPGSRAAGAEDQEATDYLLGS